MQAMMIDITQLAAAHSGSAGHARGSSDTGFAQLLAQAADLGEQPIGLYPMPDAPQEVLARLAEGREQGHFLLEEVLREDLPFSSMSWQMAQPQVLNAAPDAVVESLPKTAVEPLPEAAARFLSPSQSSWAGNSVAVPVDISRELTEALHLSQKNQPLAQAGTQDNGSGSARLDMVAGAPPLVDEELVPLRQRLQWPTSSDLSETRFAALQGGRVQGEGAEQGKILRFEVAGEGVKNAEHPTRLHAMEQRQGQSEQGFLPQRNTTGDMSMGAMTRGAEDTSGFSLDAARPAGAAAESPTGPAIRLPSGAMVPENQLLHQVVERLSLRTQGDRSQMTLRLHPEELGELRMELVMEKGVLKAHIQAQNPQVQDVLERHLYRLREALEQQGLTLDEFEVSLGARERGESSQEFASRRQQESGVPQRTGSSSAVAARDSEPVVPNGRQGGGINLRI